MKINVTNIG
jgi:hypothetical protein